MQRRKFIQQSSFGLFGTLAVTKHFQPETNTNAPFFATGIKTGEITAHSAIVWVRLTNEAARITNPSKVPHSVYLDESNGEWHTTDYFKEKYKQDRPNRNVKVIMPEGSEVYNLDGATRGIAGKIQLFYKLKNTNNWNEMPSIQVDDSTDFAGQFKLSDLKPNSEYHIKLVSGDKKSTQNTIEGKFKTAAIAKESIPVNFMVTTCHEYNDQDDPQGGVDHIDAHRSILMMAGPYVKKGYVSHTHANFGAVLKTIYNVLNVPYVNQYDVTSSLLDDWFTPKPDFTPYNLVFPDKIIFDTEKAMKKYTQVKAKTKQTQT
jgi:phosphodiesterase/alkaline phosphatase D-like protein